MKVFQTHISGGADDLTEPQTQLLAQWMQQVQTFLQQLQVQQRQAQAAEVQGQPEGGNGAAPPPNEGTQVSPNELLDETLPTAGGGANQGP